MWPGPCPHDTGNLGGEKRMASFMVCGCAVRPLGKLAWGEVCDGESGWGLGGGLAESGPAKGRSLSIPGRENPWSSRAKAGPWVRSQGLGLGNAHATRPIQKSIYLLSGFVDRMTSLELFLFRGVITEQKVRVLESLIKMYFLGIMFREQMSLSRLLGTYQLGGADLLIPDSGERGGGQERKSSEGLAGSGRKGSCRHLPGVGFAGCG